MTLEGVLRPASRVLDVGARDAGLGHALGANGVHRYLGLVAPPDRALLDAAPSGLRHRFHPLRSPEQVHEHDTDLLVLRAPFARAVWGVRDLTHVSHLAIEQDAASTWVETHGALAVSRVLGRVDHLGTTACGGSRFALFRTRPRPRRRPRHYLSETIGITGLIRRLEQEALEYVVLRWFDGLPHLDAGEDLDVLVADRHRDRLHAILAEEPGTIPVDVYSTTGLEGSDHRGMAYYPPRLAERMLARAERHASGARVPCPEDHLHSLAYHAVYHKGADSGLPSALLTTEARPDHDYAVALSDAAARLDRPFPTSLEEVDEALEARGWRPPLDTLRRLADDNPWVRHRFFPTAEEQPAELPEPTIFFIRDRTISTVGPRAALGAIDSFEFDVLAVRDLSGPARERSAELVRGGNWGRGPFPVSGGDPALVVVATHYGPRRPNRELLARYPRLTNGDVLHAKVTMRELVEAEVGAGRAFNPVHSSDDEFETWEYVGIALPEELAPLRSAVEERRRDYRTTAPVRSVLSRGRRAKVEVVEDEDGRAVVRKTFAPHGLRHMEREVATMRELAPRVHAVPHLLRTGPNWFETEFFDNGLAALPDRANGRLVPLGVARDMVRVLREIHAEGVDLLDAKPQNFLLGPDGALRVVDFEFSHRYPGAAPEFDRIYAFAGPPEGFAGDRPFGELSYECRWLPFVGLSQRSLLHAPVWRQHLERAAFRASRLSGVPAAAARSTLRQGRSGLRAARARAGAAYRAWARRRARTTP